MKEILPVPKDKRILDYIMELDSDKLSSKLFVAKRYFEELKKSCDEYQALENDIHNFIWFADDLYCKRTLTLSDVNNSDFKCITNIDIFGMEYNPTSEKEFCIA